MQPSPMIRWLKLGQTTWLNLAHVVVIEDNPDVKLLKVFIAASDGSSAEYFSYQGQERLDVLRYLASPDDE